MFGKKEEPQAKKLSAKELNKLAIKRIISEVEQLAPGQNLIYKVPEHSCIMSAVFLMVGLNPSYPEKGKKKYMLSTDMMVDGKPSGQKIRAFDSNKPIEFANWVLDRSGERYS